jgi:hypothetical protein
MEDRIELDEAHVQRCGQLPTDGCLPTAGHPDQRDPLDLCGWPLPDLRPLLHLILDQLADGWTVAR